MISTLFIMQFVLTVVLTIAVLLQKSSSIGLGAYSGSNESVFGAKGPASFLTKFTFVIGILFVVNTITLGYLYNQQTLQSAVDTLDEKSLIPQTNEQPSPTKAPQAPKSETTVPVTPPAK
ncbi:MAG: preprotein translocase subunit SecG [Campylobacteraceae bacterium 4484_166]|nr:MAG: preprotein translocase subunit SecG [Campylobacteraceae bacterium 4484_166]